jgi:hypothetical protein
VTPPSGQSRAISARDHSGRNRPGRNGPARNRLGHNRLGHNRLGRNRLGRDSPARDQQWLLALLPAFPLILLVLRLWYLSRQDLPTMLLLVQYISPLGLVSALLITLMWVLPVVILAGRALGALLWVSAPSEADALNSWLTSLSLRMPGWVVVLAILLAALTWQMRFLPALLMVSLAILGLAVRGRDTASTRRLQFACVALPIAAALAAYAWLGPAIADAFQERETVTAMLLLVPPGLATLLTGPVPPAAARLVTHWVAVGAALLAPFLIGAIFLRVPILPMIAMEVDPNPSDAVPPQVLRGHVITIDPRMTTLLDRQGTVRFVLNEQLVSKTLCPEADQVPFSVVMVHGWPVEQTALEWLTAAQSPSPTDPRCEGRPLSP